MKFTAVISALLLGASSIGIVSAQNCYAGGQALERSTLGYHSGRACRGYNGNRGAFQGTFRPGEKKTACVTVQNQFKINMEVQNLNSRNSYDLKDSDCAEEFHKIIMKCDHDPEDLQTGCWGGYNTVAGWYFRIDPNSGKC